MKKVLFSATVDSHILQFHLPFLKLFKEKGYEVHVATNGTEEIPYCDVKHVVSFERSPFKVNNLKAIKQLRKIIDNEKFDIIHTHTPMGSVVTRLAAKKARKNFHTRVIYTAHGFHFFKGAPLINWCLFYPVEKNLAKYTDTLITINQEDFDRAKRKFSKRCHDIEYVPGVGIDESKFDFKMTEKEKEEYRKTLGLKKDDFVMIFPAELNKNKNQKMLIEAMKELVDNNPQLKLLLPGRDSYNGYYQQLVKDYKLEKNVLFLGYRKDIPKLLKISNIAVASSYREGLPLNIMEAMYVGLPIIATDVRGQRDLVEDGKNGFIISVNDTEALKERILLLNKEQQLMKSMQKSNNLKVKDYLIDNISNKLQKIYFSKKYIAYLRSTAIFNDSRAIKEINSYNEYNNKVIIYGWNRKLEKRDLESKGLNEYHLYNIKANYGSGIKNILKLIRFNVWLKNQLENRINEIDIIHACDFDTAYVAKYISKKYNKKLIYDIYDYYADSHKLGLLRYFIEKKDIKIINYADYVLICTEKRKEQISKSNPRKIAIIHNSPKKIENDNKITKSKGYCDKINIGYFGILQDDRLLVEVSKEVIKYENIILHIGGFGKYEQYFKNLAKSYSNIKYYGTLTYSEVLEKEKKCDILFATYNPKIKNHKYSAPNKVYESMALNLPIIVCRNTGVEELVMNERIGEVIDYDANEFIETVNILKNNSKMNCEEIFEKKYSWQIMEKRLNSIIEELRG